MQYYNIYIYICNTIYMQHYIYVYIQYILIGYISRGHPISSGRKVCIRPLWSHQAQKKNRILGKYNHRNCHKKSLQNIRDLSVFSQRSRVQNPMLSLNILVETGIPHSWILIILNIFNSMFHHLSVISSYPHAPCVGYLPTFGPFLG